MTDASDAPPPPAVAPPVHGVATLRRQRDCSGSCYQAGRRYWGCAAEMVVNTGKDKMRPGQSIHRVKFTRP